MNAQETIEAIELEVKPVEPEVKPVEPEAKPVKPEVKSVEPEVKPVEAKAWPSPLAVTDHIEKIVLIIGTLLVAWQLKQANEHKQMDNFVAIIERTAEHNWHILENEEMRKVVEESENLSFLQEPKLRERYWAARAVHLSHINLLWHVWELEGRPSELSEHQAGWTRFAEVIVSQMSRAEAHPNGTPSSWAAHDLWKGLQEYEVHPPEFVAWLKRTIESENALERSRLHEEEARSRREEVRLLKENADLNEQKRRLENENSALRAKLVGQPAGFSQSIPHADSPLN